MCISNDFLYRLKEQQRRLKFHKLSLFLAQFEEPNSDLIIRDFLGVSEHLALCIRLLGTLEQFSEINRSGKIANTKNFSSNSFFKSKPPKIDSSSRILRIYSCCFCIVVPGLKYFWKLSIITRFLSTMIDKLPINYR